MPDIRIQRKHQLGLPAARKLAFHWAEKVEEKFDMECTYEEGDDQDTVHFTRAGVRGTLDVFADALDFHAELGLLVGAFKGRIEAELTAEIDKMLEVAPARKRKAGNAKK